jgi:hypothetical protein
MLTGFPKLESVGWEGLNAKRNTGSTSAQLNLGEMSMLYLRTG